jgi:hypothetical protein
MKRRAHPSSPERDAAVLADTEASERRRRFAAQLAPVAFVLLVLGGAPSDEVGAAGAVGLAAFAQGIGLAVALV